MAKKLPTKSYSRIKVHVKLPNLIEVQLNAFKRLKAEGLADLFHEVSPIESYNKGMKLFFPSRGPEAEQWGLTYWFDEPKYTIEECIERDLTYSSPMYVSVLLAGPEIPEPIKQEIFLGDFPEMTPKGTFIINGTERVVVSQLIRSPGVYFESKVDRSTGRPMASAKLIPDRGAWMEFGTRKSDYLTLKFNRKRTMPVTIFLRALAAVDGGLANSPLVEGTEEEIIALFEDIDTNPDRMYIASTLRQEPEWVIDGKLSIAEQALIEFFKRMRPGDPATLDNAREFLETQLFNQRHYDLEKVGRYKLNQHMEIDESDVPLNHRMISKRDVIKLVRRMIQINNKEIPPDDVDHLGNRRIKTVGELIQNKLRVGLRRMERVIKERMSIRDQEQLSPITLINIRPMVAALREFFGSSQLSQFMEQTNPLSELKHKRTVSALGPGGLRRERAGFDVRDVHHSHYGRICPIETPEGPNIGLIGRLASYARVNEYGFVETPYRKVLKSLPPKDKQLVGRTLREAVKDKKDKVIGKAGASIDEDMAKAIVKSGVAEVLIVPFVSRDVGYLSANFEDKYIIAQANAPLTDNEEFAVDRITCRYKSDFQFSSPEDIHFMDVAPHQVVGISAALIPFLEHDDANRALMGSNMMSQAVPLIRPEVPLVSTGVEGYAAQDSGQVLVAAEDGEIVSVTGSQIEMMSAETKEIQSFTLRKYQRSNQNTCIDQRPAVVKGQRVKPGDVLADSSSTDRGKLALGQNVVIAFVSWEGGNFEDAILISERLVQEDRFTSVHIDKYEVEARDTKLGPEEITRDIPNVGEDTIKDLDEYGIIRIGAEVGPGDILVGKITPKGEKELTPEERLLRAIFGEKSRDVKDTSLRMPHGEHGKVVDVQVFSRDDNIELSAGVETMVRVSVAQRRKLQAGDKMSGRHGNKGVVSQIVPEGDMPFLDDGTPVDVILNPLGVPGRMNIGQVLEVHLGWAALRLGFRAQVPVFDSASEIEIEAELARAWMIDHAWEETAKAAWNWLDEQDADYDPELYEDENEVRTLYMEQWLGDRGYDVYQMVSDYTYARRSVLREWLIDRGHNPDEVLQFGHSPYNEELRMHEVHMAIHASLRLWMDWLEVDHSGIADEDLHEKASEVAMATGFPPPVYGKQVLRDGMTGNRYDNAVTVGVMTMLKLHHLVEDKVHARSTGPYSLVTQQPLGGKAQFGGQRFGEMEVWALEAYGAAYTLQEMLTVKSDDVIGRVKTYEAIVKGEPIDEPGIPASFRVLVKELQSLGLVVEAVTDTGMIRFGKEADRPRTPKLETGLLGLGASLGRGRKREDKPAG